MFSLNESYEESMPATIRADFADLTEIYSAEQLIQKLGCYLSTDSLRNFMDDLAMGRI